MLKCTCGGELMQRPPIMLADVLRDAVPFKPRRHRKRRIAKKWAKKDLVEHRRMLGFAMFAYPLMRGPFGSYVCKSCGRNMGGYEAIGRNLFSVEPMTGGAPPYYDRDPGVAEIVVPELTSAEKQAIVANAIKKMKSDPPV